MQLFSQDYSSVAALFILVVLSVRRGARAGTTADITGRVLDQLGAAVPNAGVTIRSLGTARRAPRRRAKRATTPSRSCPLELTR